MHLIPEATANGGVVAAAGPAPPGTIGAVIAPGVSVPPVPLEAAGLSVQLRCDAGERMLVAQPESRRSTCCRDVTDFELMETIGEGTYGIVSRARDPRTGHFVAIKKVKLASETEGFPLLALRELQGLAAMRDQPNIVRLHEVVTSRSSMHNRGLGDVFMVFEYAEHDLAGLLRSARDPNVDFAMTADRIRAYMYQLLRGLAAMHYRSWVHRDLKPANLLVTSDNRLLIADLGMARSMRWPGVFTPRVVTLWYRAPELLLHDPNASIGVDVWSAGCIFAELLTGREILAGDTEPRQLDLIYKLCGIPDPDTWPGLAKLEAYRMLPPRQKYTPQFKQRFSTASPLALDLLEKLLALNPHRRITAATALLHPYFSAAGGGAVDPLALPRIALASAHDLVVRTGNAEQRRRERQPHAGAVGAPGGGGGGGAGGLHPTAARAVAGAAAWSGGHQAGEHVPPTEAGQPRKRRHSEVEVAEAGSWGTTAAAAAAARAGVVVAAVGLGGGPALTEAVEASTAAGVEVGAAEPPRTGEPPPEVAWRAHEMPPTLRAHEHQPHHAQATAGAQAVAVPQVAAAAPAQPSLGDARPTAAVPARPAGGAQQSGGALAPRRPPPALAALLSRTTAAARPALGSGSATTTQPVSVQAVAQQTGTAATLGLGTGALGGGDAVHRAISAGTAPVADAPRALSVPIAADAAATAAADGDDDDGLFMTTKRPRR